MSLERKGYYVLGGFTNYHNPWVLSCCDTLKEAQRDVAWQKRGGATPGEYKVCTYDDNRQMFIPEDGGAVDFPLRRGIYTRGAYAKFMEAHGINPKHMMD